MVAGTLSQRVRSLSITLGLLGYSTNSYARDRNIEAKTDKKFGIGFLGIVN
jgi:hypothetical protein